MTMTTTRTAASALAEHQMTAERLTFEILESVKSLKGFQTTNWGYAGTMQEVNEKLAEVALAMKALV